MRLNSKAVLKLYRRSLLNDIVHEISLNFTRDRVENKSEPAFDDLMVEVEMGGILTVRDAFLHSRPVSI